MPCVICRRRLAALPLPVCSECREVRRIATERYADRSAVCEICGEAGIHTHEQAAPRIDRRPKYTPRPRTEAPETD